MMKRFFLISLLVAFASGCFSYTTLHTATPVEKGDLEVVVAPQAWGIRVGADVDGDTDSDGAGSLVLPAAEFEIRYGVSDAVDLGFRIFLLGFGADVNYAVINQDNFAFSINPQFGITGLTSGEETAVLGSAFLNLLFDVVKTDSIILTLAAKPGLLFAGVTGNDFAGDFGTGFAPGAGVLAKFRLTEGFAIAPGFDIIIPTDVDGGEVLDVALFNFHLGLHF